MRQDSRPRVWSRRAILRQGAGGLALFGGLVLAACGQGPAAAPAGAAKSGAPEPSKPSGAAATTQGAAQPAAGGAMTKEQVNLFFMGHVAGGENEQKAYDEILEAWHQQHPNIKVEYQVVPDAGASSRRPRRWSRPTRHRTCGATTAV